MQKPPTGKTYTLKNLHETPSPKIHGLKKLESLEQNEMIKTVNSFNLMKDSGMQGTKFLGDVKSASNSVKNINSNGIKKDLNQTFSSPYDKRKHSGQGGDSFSESQLRYNVSSTHYGLNGFPIQNLNETLKNFRKTTLSTLTLDFSFSLIILILSFCFSNSSIFCLFKALNSKSCKNLLLVLQCRFSKIFQCFIKILNGKAIETIVSRTNIVS